MTTIVSRRAYLAVLGLALLAAATPAHGQYQVEVSMDHTGAASMSGIIADGPGGGFQASQKEAVRYSVGASRLNRIAPRTSLRIGLLLSNKGFTERVTTPEGTSNREVDFLYLGAPITLGYNLVNTRRGLQPFAEVGVLPEVLTRDDDGSEYFDPDMKGVGISYLLSVGLKYNLGDGRAHLRTAYVEPRNELEEAVAAVWREMLGLERVGVEDDFFQLGGHSLLGTRLIGRLRLHFGVDLPADALFRAPTIAALAREIEDGLVAVVEAMSEEEVLELA